MIRHGLAAGVVVLALAGPAPAQTFSDVVVFGDSLSDGGNAAALPASRRQGVPPGSRFTTNPDPTAADLLALAFGAKPAPSAAGGQNRAVGGACTSPDAVCALDAVPTVSEQIDAYLASRPGGRADAGALYSIWGGANDIRDAMGLTRDPARAAMAAAAAGTAAAAQSRRLREDGARHVVVFNLPDIAHTPFARAAGLPLSLWTGFSRAYNERLAQGLAGSPEGVVPVNAFALFEEVLADAASYGFENVDGMACSGDAAATTALLCGPQGSGYPFVWSGDGNVRYLFADGIHPGGGAHALLAQAAIATLEAPVMASLAGEGGVAAAAAHGAALSSQRRADLAAGVPVGGWRAWAQASFGRQRVEALPRLGRAEADLRLATMGLARRAGPGLAWGAAVSLARHDADAAGTARARLESRAALASLYGAWRREGFHLGGSLSAGRTGVDVERRLPLGAAQRLERGSTDARQLGAALELGWLGGGEVRHGPSLALAWLDQRIDGWRERGASATAMNFAAFDRDSLTVEAGYGLAAAVGEGLSGRARLALGRELKDDPLRVSAASNTMPGRFALAGFAPPARWAAASVGLEAALGEDLRAAVDYAGRFGSDSRRDHRLSLALRLAF